MDGDPAAKSYDEVIMGRIIFHVDMDAFYASIEQRDHPEYRARPVIVGADPIGKLGGHLWALAHGIDDRPVVESREPRSVGHEQTFPEDVSGLQVLEETLQRLSRSVFERLNQHGLWGRTVTLKLRYSDFTTITRQTTLKRPPASAADLYSVAERLLRRFRDEKRRVRLVGVSVSGFETASKQSPSQLKLFESGVNGVPGSGAGQPGPAL